MLSTRNERDGILSSLDQMIHEVGELTLSFFRGYLSKGMDLNREGRKGQRLGSRGA